MKKPVEKLVRDRIPDIIFQNDGTRPSVRTLSPIELIGKLREKLVEESNELSSAGTRHEILEELADVAEVFDALCKALCVCPQELELLRAKKRASRGGFERGICMRMGGQ